MTTRSIRRHRRRSEANREDMPGGDDPYFSSLISNLVRK